MRKGGKGRVRVGRITHERVAIPLRFVQCLPPFAALFVGARLKFGYSLVCYFNTVPEATGQGRRRYD
jgi:hypothetical protein